MGYQMEYGKWNKQCVYRRVIERKKKYWIVLMLLAFLLCIGFRERILEFIIPGNPEVTKSAFAEFVEEIREGESVANAFGSFCKVILDEANMS